MIFFSQNDPRWKTDKIGKTTLTLGAFGCTTSCVGDASLYFNEEKTPKVLAKSLEYTKDGLLVWSSIGKVFKKFEFEWRFYTLDRARIDTAFKDPNKVVLLNVDNRRHWVFLVGRYIPFLGYKVSDPYSFPASTYYRKDISGGAILKRK
jgi:hypothetical protein